MAWNGIKPVQDYSMAMIQTEILKYSQIQRQLKTLKQRKQLFRHMITSERIQLFTYEFLPNECHGRRNDNGSEQLCIPETPSEK